MKPYRYTSLKSLLGSLLEWLDSHHRLLLFLLAITAVLMAVLHLPGDSMLTKISPDDPWIIAENIYNGHGFSACPKNYFPFCAAGSPHTAMREPVPVLMLFASMLIYPSPIAGVMLEVVLYIAVLFVLYFSLRHDGRVYALCAAAIWVLSLPVTQEIGNGNGELEAAFWLAVGIWFFQKGRISHSSRDWILAGIFLGLAALSRTVLLGVTLGLLFGSALEQTLGTYQSRARLISSAFLSFLLVISPWAVRNQLVLGGPVFTNTIAGYNLYRHNYIVARPDFYPHYVGTDEAYHAITDLVSHSDLTGTEGEIQMQDFYLRKGLSLILSHPVEYSQLVFFRIFSLWFNTSVKASYGQKLDLLDIVLVVQQVVILGAAIAGTILYSKKLWPYILGTLLACGAYSLVNAQTRYLVDIMPLIAPLAASVVLKLSGEQRTAR